MRNININVRMIGESPYLGCADENAIIGAMWDNRAQQLTFERDSAFADYNMMLSFETGGENIDVNIGTGNSYTITNALTQNSVLRVRVSFFEGATFLYGSINTLQFMYTQTAKIGEMTAEEVNQYLELLAAAEQQVANATTAAANAQAALDSINDSLANNFGGTNLLLGTKDLSGIDSKTYVTSDTYRDFAVMHCDRSGSTSSVYPVGWGTAILVEPNAWYTLSFWAKGTGSLYSFFYSDNESTVSTGITSNGTIITVQSGTALTEVTSEWKRYWISWKTRSDVTENYLRNVVPCRVDGGNDIYMCGVMFERGQFASDWSPAPGDMVSNSITTYNPNDYVASGITITGRSLIRKIGRVVYLQLLTTSALSGAVTLMNLPTELTPSAQFYSNCITDNGVSIGRVAVDTTGEVKVFMNTVVSESASSIISLSYLLY